MLLTALFQTRRPTLDVESMLLTKYDAAYCSCSRLQYSNAVAQVLLPCIGLAVLLPYVNRSSSGDGTWTLWKRIDRLLGCQVRRWLNLTGSCFRDLGQPHGESSIAARQSFGGALPRLPRQEGKSFILGSYREPAALPLCFAFPLPFSFLPVFAICGTHATGP